MTTAAITFRPSFFVGSKSVHVYRGDEHVGTILPINGGYHYRAKGAADGGPWCKNLEAAKAAALADLNAGGKVVQS